VKVLLDENLPHDLRHHLSHHDTFTAVYAGFSGMKNGELLQVAEEAGFDVLVTGDRTLHLKQNMGGRKLALISLSAIGWPVIEPHVRTIVLAVDAATPGTMTRVDCGTFSRKSTKPHSPHLG
jgi:hypothetical protein